MLGDKIISINFDVYDSNDKDADLNHIVAYQSLQFFFLFHPSIVHARAK